MFDTTVSGTTGNYIAVSPDHQIGVPNATTYLLVVERTCNDLLISLCEVDNLDAATRLFGMPKVHQDIDNELGNPSLLKSLLSVAGKWHFVLHRGL